MSTSYPLIEQGGCTLSIDEHSNKLDVAMQFGSGFVSIDDLAPDQIVEIAAKILDVASYWMTEAEFNEATKKHFGRDINPPWTIR